MFQQPVQKRNLGFLQLDPRFLDRKKTNLVDLRKRLKLSGANRPFGAEGVAGVVVSLRHIPFAGPGVNDLTTLLRNGSELRERPLRNETDLFAELTLRGQEEIFPAIRLTLGNRPVPIILPRKKRPARVGEENLRFPVSKTVENQAG